MQSVWHTPGPGTWLIFSTQVTAHRGGPCENSDEEMGLSRRCPVGGLRLRGFKNINITLFHHMQAITLNSISDIGQNDGKIT